MDKQELHQHLSRVAALGEPLDRNGKAGPRSALVQRYVGAVYNYLRANLGDEQAAETLTQQVAKRVLRPRRLAPGRARSRLRDDLWATLSQLAARRSNGRRQGANGEEQDWVDCWREELFMRTWAVLAESSPAYFTVLVCYLRNPQESPDELAQKAAPELGGKALTGSGFRARLNRAQNRFADLLVAEVAHSLGRPSDAALVREVRELRLLDYCDKALRRRGIALKR
jgi:hypothetical protein